VGGEGEEGDGGWVWGEGLAARANPNGLVRADVGAGFTSTTPRTRQGVG